MKKDYTIKITGPDFNLECLLDYSSVVSVLPLLLKSKVDKQSGLDEGNPQISNIDTITLVNLKNEYRPVNNVDKIAVFTYFLTKGSSNVTFFEKELEDLFDILKFKKPSNFSRDLLNAIEKGFIFRLKELNNKLTCTNYLHEYLVELKKRNLQVINLKKKAVKLERTNLNLTIKDVYISGVTKNPKVYFKDLKNKALKILWIIYFLKEKNIDSVSIKDIEYVSKKLNSEIKSKHFSTYNKENVINGFVSASKNNFSILDLGIEYLKKNASTQFHHLD